MMQTMAYHGCQTCGRSFGLECRDCGVPKVEFEWHPPTFEEQYPDREIARLRQDLAKAQAEIKRLRTPPPTLAPDSSSRIKESGDDESQLLSGG